MELSNQVIDVNSIAAAHPRGYFNTLLASANDHVIRLSIMTEPFDWHYHPNSDETFIGMEGIVVIETETGIVELGPGQLYTVPRNVRHSSRPKDGRSVNLTFEHKNMETVKG